MKKNDKIIHTLISDAETQVEAFKEKVQGEVTKALRDKYKGKRVKCKCFDTWIEGDDYYFDQELLDIYACSHSDSVGGFYVMVTFMYMGSFAEEGSEPKPFTLYLESIDRVSKCKNS